MRVCIEKQKLNEKKEEGKGGVGLPMAIPEYLYKSLKENYAILLGRLYKASKIPKYVIIIFGNFIFDK
jgi:hypothetical protein